MTESICPIYVTTLCLKAGPCTLVVTVIVQELQQKVAAACSDTGAASSIAVTKRCPAPTDRTDMCQKVFATGVHLGWVVGCVICKENLYIPVFLIAARMPFATIGAAATKDTPNVHPFGCRFIAEPQEARRK